jgi:preprotein translocase subunit SecE
VAKQDEVESTGGSDAAEPYDATEKLTDDVAGTEDALDDAKPADQGDEPADDPEPEELDIAQPVDEFEEIVRHSGVDGQSQEPPGPAVDGAAKVLEPAGVAATSARARADSGGRDQVRTPKTGATAKRDQPVKRERTTPLKFVRQSVGELRKVVYPTGQQLINYFIVVLVFVLFVIAYVSLLDLGLGAAIFRIFS